MNTALEFARQWVDGLLNAPLLIQFGLGLLAAGWALKFTPQFPNNWIRSTLMLLGAVAGFWLVPMQDPGKWGFQVPDPAVADGIRRVCAGLTIAGAVVLLHTHAIRHAERWIAKKFDAFKAAAVALLLLASGCAGQKTARTAIPTSKFVPASVVPEQSLATITGEFVCPNKLVKDGAEWKTAMNDNGFLTLLRWDESMQTHTAPLQWGESISVSSGFQGVVDGRFVLGGMNTLQTGIKIAEFDPDGSLRSTHAFGDSRSRYGAYTPLAGGGLAGAVYADPLPGTNKLIFDVFYRPRGLPWFSARWEFPPNTPSPIGLMFWATEGRDGLIWFFFTHDSSGAIGLMRMRPKILALPHPTPTLELVDFDANFIHVNRGDLSPSGELPNIYAVADDGGVVLGYQSFPYVETQCQYRKLHSRNSITRLGYDKSARLLGTSPWWSPHIDFPLQTVFPRPDGVYYVTHFQGTQSCALGWNVGRFDGSFSNSAVWPQGRVTSLHPDGMMLFYETPSNTSRITQLRFRPVVAIRRSGPSVVVDWDQHSPTDVLESSPDAKTWTAVPGAVRPVVLPYTGVREFFRVRTTGEGYR